MTAFPDIGAKLGCHSLIMLTIRLNIPGKSHKSPKYAPVALSIPIIQHLGRFGKEKKIGFLALILL